MKFLKQKSQKEGARLPKNFNNIIIRKEFKDYGSYFDIDGLTGRIACLACPEKSCINFNKRELKDYRIFLNVCPTKAISFSEGTPIVDYSNCIGCGLCVLRCPYGAIRFNADYFPEINSQNRDYKKVSYSDFKLKMKDVIIRNVIQDWDKEALIKNLLLHLEDQKQDTIYPLTGSILTSIGLATRITRAGDTNERSDGVIIDEMDSIPIEIKSPTETEHIDIKSVRQALENKIIMLSRNTYNTRFETTSLSIGYRYPAARSDVEELIENIHKSYGINIGLINFEVLLFMLVDALFNQVEITINDIKHLRGRL